MTAKEEKNPRKNGILLHITSLPSRFGIGDFGPEAYRFVDFLSEAKQQLWQILPLSPTAPIMGNSPYSSVSAFAGNQILISPEFLLRDGYLEQKDIEGHPNFLNQKVDYDAVTVHKSTLLRAAYDRAKTKLGKNKDFEQFYRKNAYWLDDYSLFMALKEQFKGATWSEWPEEVRSRDHLALKEWTGTLSENILKEKFIQFLFFRQWLALKEYCKSKSIKIVGDLPIYVGYDSVDVWANTEIFKLDKNFRSTHLSGVPPDFFSSTGQLWGNPVYRWDVMKKDHFGWWKERFRHNFTLFDIIRVDHFRGFVGYWEVPAGEKTAVNGKWAKVPAKDFFTHLIEEFRQFPIIAEDLGVITDDVRAIMKEFSFPGMKLLIFAFDDTPAKNPYIPHNHIPHSVIYTGTHDNNTIRGWFEKESRPEDRNRVFRYLGREVPNSEIAWELVRLAMMSVAHTVILPIQDVLNLGADSRMNTPATIGNNWQWRLTPEMLSPWITAKFRELTEIYGRT